MDRYLHNRAIVHRLHGSSNLPVVTFKVIEDDIDEHVAVHQCVEVVLHSHRLSRAEGHSLKWFLERGLFPARSGDLIWSSCITRIEPQDLNSYLYGFAALPREDFNCLQLRNVRKALEWPTGQLSFEFFDLEFPGKYVWAFENMRRTIQLLSMMSSSDQVEDIICDAYDCVLRAGSDLGLAHSTFPGNNIVYEVCYIQLLKAVQAYSTDIQQVSGFPDNAVTIFLKDIMPYVRDRFPGVREPMSNPLPEPSEHQLNVWALPDEGIEEDID
ncbi:nonstructural protein [Salanga virus]|uniref:Nonstructural protein n=1 Tax=Salanga virus TaxID=1416745 RepID=U5XJM5_9VIRU|nr:nonstructural protein [Salanga virus]AGZ62537.1 nonstructural protein [Salanga virus]